MQDSIHTITEIKRKLKAQGITNPQDYYQNYLLREYLQATDIDIETVKNFRYFESIMARNYDFDTEHALFTEAQSLERIASGKINPPIDRAVFWSGGFDPEDPMYYGWGRKDAERWVLEQTVEFFKQQPTANYADVRDQLYHTVAMTDAGIDLLNAMWDYMNWEGRTKSTGEKYTAREQMLLRRTVTAPLIIKFAQVATGTITLNIDDTDVDSFFRQNELPVIMTNNKITQVRSVSYDRESGELTEVIYGDKFEWYQSQKNQWVDSIKARYKQAYQNYLPVVAQLGSDYRSLGSNALALSESQDSNIIGAQLITKLWSIIHEQGCWWNTVLQYLPTELQTFKLPTAEIVTYYRLRQALFDEALDSTLNLNGQNFFLAEYWQSNSEVKSQQLEKEQWRLQSLADLVVPLIAEIPELIANSNIWPDIRPKEIIQIGDRIPGFVVPPVSDWMRDINAALLMKPKAIQEVTDYFQDCERRGIHLKYHGALTQRHSAGYVPYYQANEQTYYAANIELNRHATPEWLASVVEDKALLTQVLQSFGATETITTYSLPKGRIEKGETVEQAARRESSEEIGYSAGSTDSQRVDHTASGKRGNYHLTVFFQHLTTPVELRSRGEQQEDSIPSPLYDHTYIVNSGWITTNEVQQAVNLFEQLVKLRFRPETQKAKEWIVGEYKSLNSQLQLLKNFELSQISI